MLPCSYYSLNREVKTELNWYFLDVDSVQQLKLQQRALSLCGLQQSGIFWRSSEVFPSPAPGILVTGQTQEWEERRRRGSVTGNPVEQYNSGVRIRSRVRFFRTGQKAHCISRVLSVKMSVHIFKQCRHQTYSFILIRIIIPIRQNIISITQPQQQV